MTRTQGHSSDPEFKDEFNMTDDELDDLYGEEVDYDFVDITQGERKIPRLNKPQSIVKKSDWDSVVKSNFPDLWPIAEIVLAGIGQLLIKDIVNPFGLILVDKPASGKTLALNFFSGLDELVFADDNFSPASFVTHAANKPRSELNKIDLLPKIKDGVLLVREMAPIFGKHEDQLLGNMTILTRIFDGEGYLSSSGVHSRRGYAGTFMFIFLGASTPIRPRIWRTMSSLGSRLFFVNVNSKEKDEETLVSQLLSKPYQEKVKLCKDITSDLIRTIWNQHPEGIVLDKSKMDKKKIITISKIAKMLARFRGNVGIWEQNDSIFGTSKKFSHQIPEIEQPDRINQILFNLAMGSAITSGRDSINSQDVKLVLKVALESAPYHRTKLLKFLVSKGGKVNSEEVQKMFGCSKPTALKEMEFLSVLGIAYKIVDPSGTELYLDEKFRWLVTAAEKYPELFQ